MPEYRWLGLSAPYGPNEINIIATLPVREQAFLHTLKAFTEGELEEAPLAPRSSSGSVTDSSVATDVGITPDESLRVVPEDREGGAAPPLAMTGYREPPGLQSQAGSIPAAGIPVYTDPEDIPFGDGVQTPRKRPTYALVWTWRQSRVFKTKRECIEKQRVWKKWYERQGWKVSSHATGYFARHPSGQSHSISLHEYDPVTKERLR